MNQNINATLSKMKLRASIGCYILSVYFVLSGSSADSSRNNSSPIHGNETDLSTSPLFSDNANETNADLPKYNSSAFHGNETDPSSAPLFSLNGNTTNPDLLKHNSSAIYGNETDVSTPPLFSDNSNETNTHSPKYNSSAIHGNETDPSTSPLLSLNENTTNADLLKHNSSAIHGNETDPSTSPVLSDNTNETNAEFLKHNSSEIHGNETRISHVHFIVKKKAGSPEWQWTVQSLRTPKGVITHEYRDEILEILDITNTHVKELDPSETLFYLFTKKNLFKPYVISFNPTEFMKSSYFDPTNPTVFISHRWINASKVASCSTLRDAYLTGPKDVNVIVVDFNPFDPELGTNSFAKVARVGKKVARMINHLKKNADLKLQLTTLVGHSMGAHVMGVAGRHTDGKVQQIFGLDPAREMFENPKSESRLSKQSAKNVQVIHTNGHKKGLFEPLGHSDFYPNGGVTQPGCEILDITSDGACSHSRSYYLFAESLISKSGFNAVRCESKENVLNGECSGPIGRMGGRDYRVPTNGVFYLKTSHTLPYAMLLTKKTEFVENDSISSEKTLLGSLYTKE